MMIWERVKVFLALGVCLIFFSGCAGNLFKGMDSVGSDPGTKLELANRALDQGNYTQAKEEANAIIKAGTEAGVTPEQLNNAHIVHAQALLGEAGFNAPGIMSKVLKAADDPEANDFKALDALPANADLGKVKDAAKELQEALAAQDVDSRDPNLQLTTGVASGVAAVLEVMRTFDTNGDGALEAGEVDSVLTTNPTTWDNIEVGVVDNATEAVDNLTAALGSSDNESIRDLISNADTIKTDLNSLLDLTGSELVNGIAGLDD